MASASSAGLRRMVHAIAPIVILATTVSAPAGWSLGEPHRIAPATELQELLDGNARWVANKPIHPSWRPSDAPQEPAAVILSCSDSRVPPEILFDQGVGTLFVVRAAGNTFDKLGLDSIEYAVAHLGTSMIVVMGHDQCGAVKAAVSEYPKPTTSPMLKNIYPAIEQTRERPGDAVSNTINENAILIAQKLAKDPPLASYVAGGQLKIVAARYNLATGAVTLLPLK